MACIPPVPVHIITSPRVIVNMQEVLHINNLIILN